LIPLHDLKDIYHRLRSLPVRERQKVPGLEKGREDLIIAGAVILLNLLQVFDLTTLEVIDSGLLEGVLLEGIAKS
jgi:exopolyphosphatase/guanosine-5'-triphosphate,3'-diphosphate pyrophosphatase